VAAVAAILQMATGHKQILLDGHWQFERGH